MKPILSRVRKKKKKKKKKPTSGIRTYEDLNREMERLLSFGRKTKQRVVDATKESREATSREGRGGGE